MRLLDTSSLAFEEFYDSNTPLYAIFSHRWERDEPTYQIFLSNPEHAGEGYRKVREACSLARGGGYPWIWIDTVCIDKTSSAELSEAINSMFKWYGNAAHCFVYLSDVLWESREKMDRTCTPYYWHPLVEPNDPISSWESFSTTEWFCRGWTLQELLAPRFLSFYDYTWNRIGSRDGLRKQIEDVTRIDLKNWKQACIAQKMSWIARRKTSRGEDMAYCVMGLFDVNMPMLYGEGELKAFVRLQLDIIKKSDDESVFAWTLPGPDSRAPGLLAVSPQYFKDCGDVCILNQRVEQRLPYAMTNKGLAFDVPVVTIVPGWKKKIGSPTTVLALNCWKAGKPVGIRLEAAGNSVWRRVNADSWLSERKVASSFTAIDKKQHTETVYVKQHGL